MASQYLTRDQIRELDRRAIEEFGVPGIVLMENAGRSVAELLHQLGVSGKVIICCGKGNNAGDGFVVARHLQLLGCDFELWTWTDPQRWQGDAAVNASICRAAGIEIRQAIGNWRAAFGESLASADWVVDALLGTGAAGAPRAPLDDVIQMINDAPATKIAIDLPSGLDCDTGSVAGVAVRADHTVTFVAAKPGLLLAASAKYVGQLHVAQIGAPKVLVDEMLGRIPLDGRKSGCLF